MSDEDVVERTLCQLPMCHVFKIPTRKSADGYRASDWPKDSVWSGKLKIISRGRECFILLLDDKNNVFATCPADGEGSVERTLDSGRYFVLRIKNAQGKHAFIGIAFNERNDAFDFNVALQEHKNELEREDKAAEIGVEAVSAPMKDLSIKDGEKIKINISGVPSRREKKSGSGGLGAPGLTPPRENPSTKPTSSSSFNLLSSPSSTSSSSSSSPKSLMDDLLFCSPPPPPLPSGPSSDPFGFSTVGVSSTSIPTDPFAFPSAQPHSADPFAFSSSSSSSSFPSSGDPFGFTAPSHPSSDPFAAMPSTVFKLPSTTLATDSFGFPAVNTPTTKPPSSSEN